jgi:hypothetical protein
MTSSINEACSCGALFDVMSEHLTTVQLAAQQWREAHLHTPTLAQMNELIDKVERLQRWKREAKQVLRGLDELAEVADAPLGHSIIEAAVYCIEELRKEIDSLQSTKEEV